MRVGLMEFSMEDYNVLKRFAFAKETVELTPPIEEMEDLLDYGSPNEANRVLRSLIMMVCLEIERCSTALNVLSHAPLSPMVAESFPRMEEVLVETNSTLVRVQRNLKDMMQELDRGKYDE